MLQGPVPKPHTSDVGDKLEIRSSHKLGLSGSLPILPSGEEGTDSQSAEEGRRSPSWIKAEWRSWETLVFMGSKEVEHRLWTKSQ